MGNSGSLEQAPDTPPPPPSVGDRSLSAVDPDRKIPDEFRKKGNVGIQDFTLLRTVGKGSFAKVIQVRKVDTGKVYAMKVLKKETVVRRRQVAHTLTERSILEDIDHPFIVSLRFAFQSQSKLYMIFDYFNGGELFHYLSKGRFTLERSRLYAAEIVLALEHLHNLNIVYRDLKPENILLDADGHIRITDFGLSKENVKSESGASSFVGTPEYLAPEMIRRLRYGKSVDWWCLGTLLFEMLAGLPPFYDANVKNMYKKILDDPLEFPPHFTPEACDVLRRLLVKDPEGRIRVAELKAHAFFAPIAWDALMRREIQPPFRPRTRGDSDTSNVASTFTKIPAQLSPTPSDHSMMMAMAASEAASAALASGGSSAGQLHRGDPDNLFPNFSFVHSGLMGGPGEGTAAGTSDGSEAPIYSVSMCAEDYPPVERNSETEELDYTDAIVMAEVVDNAAEDGLAPDGSGWRAYDSNPSMDMVASMEM